MKSLRAGLLALVALGLAVPAGAADVPAAAEASALEYFDASQDASFILETGVAEARERGSYAVVVFGADWCHDSVALAEVLTSAEFERRFGQLFYVSFIDVGKPQTGEGRNLDVVAELGLKRMRSTPALFALAGDGKRLNSVSDARSWRDAASRGQDKILAWFDRFLAKRK